MNQFEQTLDKDPEDWITRLVYADWLDEHDQPVLANGQRQQAKLEVRPWYSTTDNDSHWYPEDKNNHIDKLSDLPQEIFDKLTMGQAYKENQFRFYKTRQEAEADFAQAVQ